MKKIVTFGEVMLRLKAPGYELLFQSPIFEATFGGGEANVAASIARFGLPATFVTVLPKNPLGDACMADLRSKGIDTSFIIRAGKRLGVYYLEAGANQRPSQVVYDREHSAFSEASSAQFDWERIFEGAGWFHVTGITPALNQQIADITLQAVQCAKAIGLTVSCDYNYRSKLWRYGKSAPDIMSKIVPYVDIGIGNEEDCQHSLGIGLEDGDWKTEIQTGVVNLDKYERLCEKVLQAYPNLKYQTITLRESKSANHNGWSACLHNKNQFFVSCHYDITDIVDRVGSGDAFSAGLIYGLYSGLGEEAALNFATAASCLKHSILGDVNLVSVEKVNQLLSGDVTGRVRR